MATAAVNHICSICLEIFTDPKIIDCHHTFCLKCLEDLVHNRAQNNQFMCPLCNRNIAIPQGGVKSFPVNFYIEHKPFSSSKSRKPCQSHRQKEVEFQCQNCGVDVCSKCVTTVHTGHKLTELEEVSSVTTEKIQYLNQELGKVTLKLENQYDSLKTKLLEIQNVAEASCHKVDTHIERLCSEIRTNGEDMKAEITKYLQDDSTKLDGMMLDCGTLITKLRGMDVVSEDSNFNVIRDEIVKGRKLHGNIESKTLTVSSSVYSLLSEERLKASLVHRDLLTSLATTNSTKTKDETVFRFTLEHMTETKKRYYSRNVNTIQGLTWRVAAVRHTWKPLGLYLNLLEDTNRTIKSCDVYFTFTMINHKNADNAIVKHRRATFTPGAHIGWWDFVEENRLKGPQNGFIDDLKQFKIDLYANIINVE